MQRKKLCALVALICLGHPVCAGQLAKMEQPGTAETSNPAVDQLRHVIGDWDVATTFFKLDGSEAGTYAGSYTFSWVMEDKIVQGISTIPQFALASGMLLYLRDSTGEIEMVSVGPDGQLWVMTGKQDSETRETPVVEMPDGSTLKLRFTRYNVTEDKFESRMERSFDGGQTWSAGNHQVFKRASS